MPIPTGARGAQTSGMGRRGDGRSIAVEEVTPVQAIDALAECSCAINHACGAVIER